jgi:hypothetical protein
LRGLELSLNSAFGISNHDSAASSGSGSSSGGGQRRMLAIHPQNNLELPFRVPPRTPPPPPPLPLPLPHQPVAVGGRGNEEVDAVDGGVIMSGNNARKRYSGTDASAAPITRTSKDNTYGSAGGTPAGSVLTTPEGTTAANGRATTTATTTTAATDDPNSPIESNKGGKTTPRLPPLPLSLPISLPSAPPLPQCTPPYTLETSPSTATNTTTNTLTTSNSSNNSSYYSSTSALGRRLITPGMFLSPRSSITSTTSNTSSLYPTAGGGAFLSSASVNASSPNNSAMSSPRLPRGGYLHNQQPSSLCNSTNALLTPSSFSSGTGIGAGGGGNGALPSPSVTQTPRGTPGFMGTLRVLLVDDSIAILKVTGRALEQAGHKVTKSLL